MTHLLFGILPLDLQKLLIRYCCPAVRYELKSCPFFNRFALVAWTKEEDILTSVCELTRDKEHHDYCLNILLKHSVNYPHLLKIIAKNQALEVLTTLHREHKITDESYHLSLIYIDGTEEIINKYLRTKHNYCPDIYYQCSFNTFEKIYHSFSGLWIERLLVHFDVKDRYEKVKLLHSKSHPYIKHFNTIYGDINVIKYVSRINGCNICQSIDRRT